jgi:NADH:ubiquinone oxidoreductase subunit E
MSAMDCVWRHGIKSFPALFPTNHSKSRDSIGYCQNGVCDIKGNSFAGVFSGIMEHLLIARQNFYQRNMFGLVALPWLQAIV